MAKDMEDKGRGKMNKCLNCDNPIPDDKVYCDNLCHQGYTNRQYKKFDSEFRSRLGY